MSPFHWCYIGPFITVLLCPNILWSDQWSSVKHLYNEDTSTPEGMPAINYRQNEDNPTWHSLRDENTTSTHCIYALLKFQFWPNQAIKSCDGFPANSK